MPIEIQVAFIGAIATVLAALIATLGVFAIVAHRRTVIKLTKQIVAYHHQDVRLIEMIIRNEGREATKALTQSRRGQYRNDAATDDRPSMTPKQAREIRRRYLSTD